MKKKFSILKYIPLIVFFSCQENIFKKNNTNVKIYKLTYNDSTYSMVEALMLRENSLYLYSNDTLLMTYDKVPYLGKEIYNVDYVEKIKQFDFEILNEEKFSDCATITKNEYLIRIIDKFQKRREFIIPQFYDCKKGSKYEFINFLNQVFSPALRDVPVRVISK